MDFSTNAPRITSFLVKIASRCNLACDYCYMYAHADQSWRDQPAFMSESNRRLLARRIGEYAKENELDQLVVIFHGGEPLLSGPERITETVRWIRRAVPDKTQVDFSLQTNGTLLTQEVLNKLEGADVGISLSIDGDQKANDLHRLGHNGFSSFDDTLAALKLLEKHPSIYSGLIAVIDPKISPQELFDFFVPLNPPRLDFLLPDANYDRSPPGRAENPDLYKDWLLQAFDVWFDSYSHLPVRMFDAILGAAAGIPSDTDAFGFGDVNLLTIETDGTYHDLDVLKITAQNATKLGYSLESHKIEQAAASEQISLHRKLLQKEGLSTVCHSCPEVDVCGGGAVAHRYSNGNFDNPTIYCEEMYALLQHSRNRVSQVLSEGERFNNRRSESEESINLINLSAWESSETSSPDNEKLLEQWVLDSRPRLESILDSISSRYENLRDIVEQIKAFPGPDLNHLSIQPAVQSWVAVSEQNLIGISVTSLDGIEIKGDPNYIITLLDYLKNNSHEVPRIHQNDRWLRKPFGETIVFEDKEEVITESAELTKQAFNIISTWKPALFDEIGRLSPDIQFIHDPTAHPDKAVSFSDNTTPGALYVGVKVSGKLIDPYLLADSIIHEHRHQKLYLLQRAVKLFDRDTPLVRSPWRDDLRPPSGLLHALFVFVCLYEYWSYLHKAGAVANRERSKKDAEQIREKIEEAFPIIYGTSLTTKGLMLVRVLENNYQRVLRNGR